LEFNAEYLPWFSWAGDSRLIVQTLDRAQRNLRIESIDVLSNKRDTLMTERDRDWINVHDDLRVVDGGSQFLWSAERSGLRHLCLYSGGGNLIRRLTEGDWEVSSVRGVDKEAGIVYFTANCDNPIGSDLYAVQLKGGPVRRVTSGIGTHAVVMNPSATHYVDAHSTMQHPGDVVVRSPGGELSRVIHEAQSIDGYELAEPELGTISNEDGAVIRTLLLKPKRLERGKKYPLLIYVYSGPHAPTIRDSWDTRGRYEFHQRLAQQGFVVAYVDDRASSLLGVLV
jgi:dipeptidyl-peptidase-4